MAIIGNPILLSGGGSSSRSLFNFPISISANQPTPEIEGHIWINTTRGNNITSVHIVDNPTSSLPNNSLIFQVYDTKNSSISLIQDFKVNGIGTVQMKYNSEAFGNHPWLVNSSDETTTYLAYPRVFIKLNGVLYLETAYVWNGSYWMLLSQADTYLFSLNGTNSIYDSTPSVSPINVYNNTNSSYSLHTDIAASSTTRANSLSVSDANGMYIGYIEANKSIYVYKRAGDTFSLYFSMKKEELVNYLPEAYKNYYFCYPTSGDAVKLSAIGDYLAIAYVYQTAEIASSYGSTKMGLLILKNNGTTFVYNNNIDISSVNCSGGSNSPNNSRCCLNVSDDFSVIATSNVIYDYQSSGYSYLHTYNCVLVGSPSTSYTVLSVNNIGDSVLLNAVSKDGSCVVFPATVNYGSDTDYHYYVYSVDKNTLGLKNLGNMYSRSSQQVVRDIYISADNHIWLMRSSNMFAGEPIYIEQAKVVNGVFTKLVTEYTMKDGSGNIIYDDYDEDMSDSTCTYNDMCIDVKNNLLYIATRSCIYICDMARTDTGALSSYTLKTRINNVHSYAVHNQIAITPNLVM